ncbi:endonuclease/exonuclease/phosphatase family protein [Curtobacterium sp. MCBD17_003]|uniref:endonuclease/exonuclease/phosphatase family protein n=1 Tax=Curtobacterium sp. MCBD17_003 TaxID=2175667 RepID=UPI000DA83968|nr:endonuclease/exonuclease/phosphatase family protein [Curtobacterium sp. MCBD17_003]WIE54448.1 endonuclease/exonuclease/phosphatase family protein [Curtobacterium sp. MCBD17_003]
MSSPSTTGGAATLRTAVPLTVMTYNVKNHHHDPAHDWADRLPLLVAIIRRNDPDVLCVQEAFHAQMEDLRAALPEYGDIGQGREGGERGEYAAVFHRRDRVAVEEDGAFWLSDTPDAVGSNTWNTSHVRMATWGRFHDLVTDERFTLLTTHTDYVQTSRGAEVRRMSADLIAARLADASGPVVVTGDFNEGAGVAAASERLAVAGFADAWTRAGADDPVSSFNGWEPPVDGGVRIDWILTRGPVEVEGIRIDHDDPSTWSASDHFPVVARLVLGV